MFGAFGRNFDGGRNGNRERDGGDGAPRKVKVPKGAKFIPPTCVRGDGRPAADEPSRRNMDSRDLGGIFPLFALPPDAAAPMDIAAIQM